VKGRRQRKDSHLEVGTQGTGAQQAGEGPGSDTGGAWSGFWALPPWVLQWHLPNHSSQRREVPEPAPSITACLCSSPFVMGSRSNARVPRDGEPVRVWEPQGLHKDCA
jgi:hypothetical protein